MVNLILIISLSITMKLAFAHSDGHGEVDANKAISLAQKAATMLSIKDYDMAVGQIDESWSTLEKHHFEVIKQDQSAYFVKAINQISSQTLYFTISKTGQIQEVQESMPTK